MCQIFLTKLSSLLNQLERRSFFIQETITLPCMLELVCDHSNDTLVVFQGTINTLTQCLKR